MNLAITLTGQTNNLFLKNPVIAASGTFGSGLEFSHFGDISALGGISVKGISLKPKAGNKMPRIAETTAGMLNSIGLQNDGIEHFLNKTLPQLPWKQTAIIANIYGSSVEEIKELCEIINYENKIAAIELNISCPNVKAGGMIFGASANLCAEVTSAARKYAPAKFLIVKLSPNVTDIAEIAKSAEGAGADCLSAINTLLGMAIDAAAKKPLLANIIGGFSGPAIKPVALRCVWQIANAVKIPVIGIGGIVSLTDIAEFMLAGASAIQVGTANFIQPDNIFNLVKELPSLLELQHIEKLSDLTGGLITG